MKYFHLTILRNLMHYTVFCQASSIESFLAIEKEIGHTTFVLYSRELTKEEYHNAKGLGL